MTKAAAGDNHIARLFLCTPLVVFCADNLNRSSDLPCSCSVCSAAGCSGHGRCRGWTGKCECYAGWSGDRCDVPRCSEGFSGPNCLPCKQNSYTGKCTENCTSLGCNGHGRCRGSGKCECFPGYSGISCNETASGCAPGFSGSECLACKRDVYTNMCNSSCTFSTCNYHGRCSGPGICMCFKGWTGGTCNVATRAINDGGTAQRRLLQLDTQKFELDVELHSWPETTSPEQIEALQSQLALHYESANITIISVDHIIPPDILSDEFVDNEAGQQVSFGISPLHVSPIEENNGPLFVDAPIVHANGTLDFTTSPYRNGDASFDVVLYDDGGVERGGADTSSSLPFILQVQPVNDAPSFHLLSFVQTPETDAGVVTAITVASDISRGPPLSTGVWNEDDQLVTFTVTLVTMSDSNNDLFADNGMPIITSDGILTLELEPYMNFSVVLNVSLQDSGGQERGGKDTSTWQSLTLKVLPVNQRPSFRLPTSEIHVWEAPSMEGWHRRRNATCRPNTLTEDALQEIPQKTNLSLAAVAVDIEAGPSSPEEERQSVRFILDPFECRVPSTVLDGNSSGCNNLYGSGACEVDPTSDLCSAGQQLLQTGTEVRMLTDGTLVMELEPERFGVASFLVRLQDNGACSLFCSSKCVSTVESLRLVGEGYVSRGR